MNYKVRFKAPVRSLIELETRGKFEYLSDAEAFAKDLSLRAPGHTTEVVNSRNEVVLSYRVGERLNDEIEEDEEELKLNCSGLNIPYGWWVK